MHTFKTCHPCHLTISLIYPSIALVSGSSDPGSEREHPVCDICFILAGSDNGHEVLEYTACCSVCVIDSVVPLCWDSTQTFND